MSDARALLQPILAIHDHIRSSVVDACTRQATDELAVVAAEDVGDTIYRIDRVAEEVLVEGFRELAREEPICLVAEGLGVDAVVIPDGAREADCRWRVIMDPIDGTRGIMYQKRSAWVLTGVAPNRGSETRLRDIVLAVQTEIPLVKQHLCDQLWAARGTEVGARRVNRLTGEVRPLTLRPSRADTIAHGFASVTRLFPGVRDVLALIDDEIVHELIGPPLPGKTACFEDQYASSGGQLYELMAGHDRFVADLRPLVQSVHAERGLPAGICAHPYDLCTWLIAEELGVEVTAPDGSPFDAPFDLSADVAWVGYANARLRSRLEPIVHRVLRRHELLPASHSARGNEAAHPI
jgi:fructose-1,6-bisphosphatase/inositol monophosphatase family enzyme